MNKLSLFDQLIYKLDESGFARLLICGAIVLDPAESPYPFSGKKLADHLAARMEKIPLTRQKLVQDRLKIGHTRLVDDPDFDMRNHITRVKLEAPGNHQQFMDCLGAFSSQGLDLSRPLWHYEIIEGLEGGRIAIATHLHHSIMDGIGAREALNNIYDTKPVAVERPKLKAKQVPPPSSFELQWDALKESADRLAKAPRLLLKSSSPISKMLIKKLTASLKSDKTIETTKAVKVPPVHKTSLNATHISPKRVVSSVEFPLAEIKTLARHFGCSINDLVLLLSSFALEYYFAGIGEIIDFDLVALMPINIRESGDVSIGNSVTPARLSFHNRTRGVVARLRAIARDTASIKRPFKSEKEKSSAALDGKGLLGLFSPIVLDALVYGVVKFNLLEKAGSFFNVVVSNVPGSPVPLYIGGARQVSVIPMAPAFETAALTITATSTDSHLIMGFHGCAETVKEKELLVEGASKCFATLSFATLKKATGSKPRPNAKPTAKTGSTPPVKKSAVKAKAKPKAKPKVASH